MVMITPTITNKKYITDRNDYVSVRNIIHNNTVTTMLLFSMMMIWALVPFYKYKIIILLLHATILSFMNGVMVDAYSFGITMYTVYLILGTYIFDKIMYGRVCFDIASIVIVTLLNTHIKKNTRIVKRVMITNDPLYGFRHDIDYVIDCEKVLFKEYKSLKSIINIEKFMSYIVRESAVAPNVITSKLLKYIHKCGYPNKLMIVNVTNSEIASSIAKELNLYYDNVVNEVTNKF